ncbi:hypothetical protein BU14_0143s0024, partial [Porphyra umbilicalis]
APSFQVLDWEMGLGPSGSRAWSRHDKTPASHQPGQARGQPLGGGGVPVDRPGAALQPQRRRKPLRGGPQRPIGSQLDAAGRSGSASPTRPPPSAAPPARPRRPSASATRSVCRRGGGGGGGGGRAARWWRARAWPGAAPNGSPQGGVLPPVERPARGGGGGVTSCGPQPPRAATPTARCQIGSRRT